MKVANRLIVLISVLLCHSIAIAQVESLHCSIEKIVKDRKAVVGVAVCSIGGTDTISINGTARLPMLSVFKFHIALAVLDQVDKGKLALNEEIKITKADLWPDTWSPIRDKYPNADISLTVAELIKYSVAQSDNNGCDILLKLIGGTTVVESYLRRIGAVDVVIKANERQMYVDMNRLYQNWTSSKSAIWLLTQFYMGNAVSDQSRKFLYKIMTTTSTGTKRLKGLLPTETVVAHKTGSSGPNAQGITAATNDIGIVVLPDGSAYAIAVFVSDSKEDNTTNEAIIAEISKVVWQYYADKSK